jgi:hypothetical protein
MVSVGTFLVNCFLQTGQGLVITYVITLFSLRARTACPPVHVACQKSCRFADRSAPNWSVPEQAAAGMRKRGRARLRQRQPLLAHRVAEQEPGRGKAVSSHSLGARLGRTVPEIQQLL